MTNKLTLLATLLFAGVAFGEPAAVGPKQTVAIVNQAADAGALGAYVYYADTANFVFREFHLPSEDEALAERIRKAKVKLAAASSVDDPAQRINAQVAAQLEVGHVLLSAGDFERARVEYQEAFQYPARDQLEWRSTIQVHIADSYMKEKKYPEAVAAYEKAQKIGLYGWRIEHAATKLQEARELASPPGSK